MNVRYHGYLDGIREAYVNVDGQDYLIKKATFEKFSHCIGSAKWLTEEIEFFAYEVIVKKGLTNSEYFEKVTK